ncbi:MAG TPA: DNA cytosine methyltransferase [Enhygromyxa sp.]|nr:DNA cytosine methyltransferase [Enhygromyxa sp.]
MTAARTYKVVTLFCGLGAKTIGLLRARSRAGSRFVSVGAFDLDELACKDFELLTGAMAQVVDLGKITTWQLAHRCEGVPDVVVMSPPCKGFSGCLPESLSKQEKYEALNRLAYQAVKLAVDTWRHSPPKLILLENVPRMRTRGKAWLAKIKALLRKRDYDVDEQPHDCGEWGGLAQKRERLLLVARLRSACPSHLLRPPNLGLRPMSSVLWRLPPPVPGSTAGGPHHDLPMINALNWLRLAGIPGGQDWRCIPERVHLVDVDPRLPSDGRRHAGKYGPQDPAKPAHAVIAEARTGKGWSDVADPRCGGNPQGRQSGLYGVGSSEGPSHTVVAAARAGSHSWASVTDPRLGDRSSRQNGGFGVNDSDRAGHAVLAEGTPRNTWSSVADPRLDCTQRGGSYGVSDSGVPGRTVVAHAHIDNSTSAVADPRSEPRFASCIRKGPFKRPDGGIDPRSTCSRFEDAIGLSDVARPYKTPVIGHQKIENCPSSVADPRVTEQNRGNYGVQDPARPSACVRATHRSRTAPASIADGRPLFQPTHQLVAGQPWTGDRDAWTSGDFWLVGPEVKITKGARGTYLIILAPDGTVHRPMTTAELMLLQNIPVWHRPGDPTELEIGDPSGQWVQLHGPDSLVREHVGNAVPIATAKAIGTVMLELLDLGASEVFSLSSAGIWVREAELSRASA